MASDDAKLGARDGALNALSQPQLLFLGLTKTLASTLQGTISLCLLCTPPPPPPNFEAVFSCLEQRPSNASNTVCE